MNKSSEKCLACLNISPLNAFPKTEMLSCTFIMSTCDSFRCSFQYFILSIFLSRLQIQGFTKCLGII